MSKFLLLNFEDFGLNQDITKTIQTHSIFCICCLRRNVPHINLTTCTHAEFLNSFGIQELNPVNQVVCYQCHDMLKKIKIFKLQVESNLKLLVSQQNIEPDAVNQRLHNLMVQKVIDIEIPLTNSFEAQTNQETTDKNDDSEFKFEIPVINASYLESSSTAKSLTEKKTKNIEEALRIIDGNKSNDCINLLATSLKSFASTSLNNISDMLMSVEEVIQPNDTETPETNETLTDDFDINNTGVASNEIANKSLPVLKKEDAVLPVVVKIESIKTENMVDEFPDTSTEQHTNEEQTVNRINLTTVTLTKEQLTEERVNTAASHAYLSYPYRCDWCLLGFRYKENLEDHTKRKHTTRLGSITCEICLQVLYPPGSYNAHTFRHYTRLECSVCGKRFELHKEAEAIEHYKKEHTTPVNYRCQQCPYTTRLKTKFKYHIKKHSNFTCNKCKSVFDDVKKLETHMKLTQHNIKAPTAKRPVKRTKIYRCKICKKIFKEAMSLQIHRIEVHPDAAEPNRALHICQQCGKKYKTRAYLKQHLKIHLKKEKI